MIPMLKRLQRKRKSIAKFGTLEQKHRSYQREVHLYRVRRVGSRNLKVGYDLKSERMKEED